MRIQALAALITASAAAIAATPAEEIAPYVYPRNAAAKAP